MSKSAPIQAPKVAVIGAGVIGLSTALCIQKIIPGIKLHIIADKFSPHTTSDISAGFWQPYLLADTPKELQWKWCKDTFDFMMDVSRYSDASEAGVQMLSGYTVFKEKVPDPYWKDIVLGFRHTTVKEIKQFEGQSHGWFFTTFGAECRYYLPWIMRQLKSAGAEVYHRKVQSLSELSDDYDAVINCSGLGAKELTGDREVQPIRGQVMRVKAPWIKYFFSNEDLGDIYMLPVINEIILGGTHQYNSYNEIPSEQDKKRIWEGACRFIPSLKNAKIVSEWAGLRPSRRKIRLEPEMVRTGKKQLMVIHNYGHGGAGITLHWGCAKDATELLRTFLIQQKLLPQAMSKY